MYKILNKDEAREAISHMDSYLEAMSGQVMAAKMNSNTEVNKEIFIEFLKETVIDFSEEESKRLGKCLDKMFGTLKEVHIKNLVEIKLVKTNGQDEWNSAYTRGNTIFLPTKKLNKYDDEGLYKLLLHEYFHVYSRLNKDLRSDLYTLLGFKFYDVKRLPLTIQEQIIFNPDAMEIVSTNINHDGNKIDLVPLIIMEASNIDTTKDITLSIKLKAYSQAKNTIEDMDSYPALKEKLLINTNFPQHPEETLAENFVWLIEDEKSVEKPEFLGEMNKIIREKSNE